MPETKEKEPEKTPKPEKGRPQPEKPAKHPGGRPLKFPTVGDLTKKIAEYFVWAAANEKPLTICRLACFLDCDRVTLLNYAENDEFFSTIQKAKQKIQADKAERLNTQTTVAGIIFDLKNNHGWRDQHDITSGGEKIAPQFISFEDFLNRPKSTSELDAHA